MRRLPAAFREHNPLDGMQPFVMFNPNEWDGYFWGRSEICNIGSLQMQMNARWDGIARLLRRQEKPPRLFTGTTAISRDKYSAMDMPGGFFVDPSPQAKQQALYPELPEGMWESLEKIEEMFDNMSGMPPVMRGRGESGVRAQGHARTLTQNASPRFKERALGIEASVTQPRATGAGDGQGDGQPDAGRVAQARDAERGRADEAGRRGTGGAGAGDEAVPVQVGSHPRESQGARRQPFVVADLRHGGAGVAVRTRQGRRDRAGGVAGLVHPPNEEEAISALERKEIAQAKLIAQHPELLEHGLGGGRKKK